MRYSVFWKFFFPIITILVLASFIGSKPIYKKPTPYMLRYPDYFGNRIQLPTDNPLTQEGIALGRMLFYEPLLSKTNTISCASCHRQELAFTDGRDKSIGINNQLSQRNAMSLANLLWVRNLFWDGRAGSLEEQAVFPLTSAHEMGQELEVSSEKLQQTEIYPNLFQNAFGSSHITGESITKALAQFQRTLISSNAAYDRYLRGEYKLTEAEQLGMDLFFTMPEPDKNIRGANCGHCHGSPKLYKELFHNNGLLPTPSDSGRISISGNSADVGRFRVPTLRSISLTAPYMHDGRFETLEEVIDHYNGSIQDLPYTSGFLKGISNDPKGKTLGLSAHEKEALITFLHLLTDSTFITNPEFSNPFQTSN